MVPFYRADLGWRGRDRTCDLRIQSPAFCQLNYPPSGIEATVPPAMGSLIKKRRKRMRKKKHKKMLKATRWQRRAGK